MRKGTAAMRTHSDPLYTIFEQHLFNALVENETTEEFLDRVVQDYLAALCSGGIIPQELRAGIEADLRDEVLEMLRKKTYGHFSLKEFRKAKVGDATPTQPQPQAAQQRRARRAS